MNREQAIKKAANKKGNPFIAEFVYDVCVGVPERLEAAEIVDRLDAISVKTNVSTIVKLIRKYVDMGLDVGELPSRESDHVLGSFNWNPKPVSKNEFKHLKGAW